MLGKKKGDEDLKGASEVKDDGTSFDTNNIKLFILLLYVIIEYIIITIATIISIIITIIITIIIIYYKLLLS